MKIKFALLAISILLAQSVLASESSVMEMPTHDSFSSDGVRIALVKPFIAVDLRSSRGSAVKEDVDTIGASLGYAKLPVRELGFTTNAAVMQLQKRGISHTLARLDGSLGYAFNSFAYLKGGLNLSKFVSKGISELEPALGYQAGAGYQFDKNIGLEASYVVMNQSLSRNGGQITLQESGLELSASLTF